MRVLYHCCMDVNHVLRLPAEQAGQVLRDTESGQTLTAVQAWTMATILKASGRVAIPMGCPTPNRDGTCPGHESP